MLTLRLESAGPELGVETASEGLSQHSLYALGQLRVIGVDICGDQDGCTSLTTLNAILKAPGLILAPSSLACRSGLLSQELHVEGFSNPNLLQLIAELFPKSVSMATSSCPAPNEKVLSVFFSTAPMFC